MNIQHDLYVLLPELVLAIGAMVLLLVGAVRGDRSAKTLTILSVILIAVSAYLSMTIPDGTAFSGAFVMDSFARFNKAVILWSSAACMLMAHRFFDLERTARFELPVLMVLASLGMTLMVSASNFIALYMGLELQSLALYVLAAFNRDSVRSSEAGLKYFLLGSLSSGMMLYGISMIYGFTGSLDFHVVARVLAPGVQTGQLIGLIFGLVFLLAGLAFKISAVPFHMWTPDVYEGAPTPITAYLATASKVASLAMVVRAVVVPFPSVFHQWQQIVVAISALSMALGAFAAIGQTNIKRLMAYSSIGHMGYALLGLAAGSQLGIRAVLFYLAFYSFTNIGVFACIQAMRRAGRAVEGIADLAGMARTQPALAFALSALMLSLAGLPPVAGIVAKALVFLAALDAHLYALAIFGVLTSVVGAYYYLRIVKVMYFDEAAAPFDRTMGWSVAAIAGIATVLTFAFVVRIGVLYDTADFAARNLLK
ncbi:MAG: NADH-quinone oxidoreductase subunit NuoN [Alphaproteobacteria bacterium]|nr:NADH-quinone oxidoreductase subunit NuoN [Alphaproteobacteria bacterium]MBV9693864.1 NADH-quinone oxidoreductase subunit NuoN [Alphaproteobacteria bacterium]